MEKADLARLIDAYADSKVSGNKYLVEKMIGELDIALSEVCASGNDMSPAEIPPTPHDLPPLTPPSTPEPEKVPVGAGY